MLDGFPSQTKDVAAMWRRRILGLIGIVGIGLLVAAGMLVAGAAGFLQSGPTYSVAAVNAGLQRDPHHWLGRTVALQGSVGTAVCDHADPLAPVCYFLIADLSSRSGLRAELILEPGAPNPLLATLRRIPGVGRLIPAPQSLEATCRTGCRVRLQLVEGVASQACQSMPCYEGLLLDARQS